MRCVRTFSLISLACLAAAGLAAQTQIGGGTCNSSSLNGTYAVTLSGRQVTSAGSFSNIFQANGSVSFDGQNKVTFALTSNTLQALGSQISYAGTYSVQANCAGLVNITSGGSVTFNLGVYNQGKDFLIAGSDATYSYTGSGGTQPTGCATSMLSGVYTFNATGYSFSSSVQGVTNAQGLLQFDGQGNAIANLNSASGGMAIVSTTASGTYSLSANCLGTATLTDASGNGMSMTFSITAAKAANFDVLIAEPSKFMVTGSGRAVYGQPTAAAIVAARDQIGGGTCSTSMLSGSYSMSLSGRGVSSTGAFTGSLQANGTATFDGQGNLTWSLTANSNQHAGMSLTYSGTYAVASNCSGTVNLIGASAAPFALVIWNSGQAFATTGQDAAYVYSGTGTKPPAICGNSTLSGEYLFSGTGLALSGATAGGAEDEIANLQFDGQGNLSASYSLTGSTTAMGTGSGTYSLSSNCTGMATLTGVQGTSNLTFAITNATGSSVNILFANASLILSGTAHSSFLNPSASIGNVASYATNSTPPGSVFLIFGQNFATRAAQPASVPLPTTLLNTSVMVNGIAAPLFYVDQTQIDAQMPWEIPGGTLATIVVKNGTTTSNAAAVFVPASGTPGISVYSNNRAVVVNQNGSVNSSSAGAKVGDEVVAYFTGGGPVNAAGKLTTGAASPAGLSPITGDYTVTVGGQPAAVEYIGLTPGSVGLYQVNFTVPQLVKGNYAVLVTIAGQASNGPVMTVSN